jgi:hypothetical protein
MSSVDKDLPDSEHLAPDERLDSWKEISVYLRRTVRTVQRWEQTEELPVHRIAHDKRSTVYAYKRELDGWWRSRQATKSGRLVSPGFVAESKVEPGPFPVSRRADFYWIMLVALAVVTGAVLYTRM